MKTWVLIDLSFLSYRAMYSMQGMSYEDQATGVVYGFFEAIRRVCFDPRIQSNQVLIFEDSRESFRRDAFPAYKLRRNTKERTPEELAARAEMHKQLDLMKETILPETGFPLYKQKGLESDDLMAQAALQLQHEDKVVIVTADQDLFQCINHNVSWFNGQDLFMTPEALWKHKEVKPKDWAAVKSVCGCKSDEVPGITGIGEKTAIHYVQGVMPIHCNKYKMITNKYGQAIIERNLPLVTLPHARTKKLDLRAPEYDMGAFFRWAKKLGFRSYLDSKHREWENFFSGSVESLVSRTPTRRPGEDYAKRQPKR